MLNERKQIRNSSCINQFENITNGKEPIKQEATNKISLAIDNIANDKCYGVCISNEISTIYFFLLNALGFKDLKLDDSQKQHWEHFSELAQSASQDSWKGLSILRFL